MTLQMNIRRASENDVAQLANLFDLYRQFYKRESDLPKAMKFLQARIQMQDSVIFVAENQQSELIGFAQLYPSFTSLGMQRSFILNDLFVTESTRLLGVGKRLMDSAHEYALAAGAKYISLETQPDNARAQALYEGLGYVRETDFFLYCKTLQP